MAEQAIEMAQAGFHRSVWTDSDTGDTISGYRHGVVKTVFVASTTAGTIAIADSQGTVFATWTPVELGSYDINVPFEGVLTLTIGGTISFTLVIEA